MCFSFSYISMGVAKGLQFGFPFLPNGNLSNHQLLTIVILFCRTQMEFHFRRGNLLKQAMAEHVERGTEPTLMGRNGTAHR